MSSISDQMTGLPRKEAFDSDLGQLVEDGRTPLSVGFLDVDNFLAINKNHGRDGGDRVLTEMVVLFQSLLGDGDTLYRIGGDEFAVVMPETEKEQAFLNLEQARSGFSALESLKDISPGPSISIGVATYPDDGAAVQEVLRKADDALFRGKSAGRDRVSLAREEKKVPKTSHYTQGQLERLSVLSKREGVGEAELLREALDDLLKKYTS